MRRRSPGSLSPMKHGISPIPTPAAAAATTDSSELQRTATRAEAATSPTYRASGHLAAAAA